MMRTNLMTCITKMKNTTKKMPMMNIMKMRNMTNTKAMRTPMMRMKRKPVMWQHTDVSIRVA